MVRALLLAAILSFGCKQNAQELSAKKLKTASSEYIAPSPLIKSSMVSMKEYMTFSPEGYMDSLKGSSCSGNTCSSYVMTHDSLENMLELYSFNNNVLEVYQKNTYNERGDLHKEFRIETSDEGQDTIVYDYIYFYGVPGEEFIAYRLNNGDTVTRYFITENDSIELKRTEAYPARELVTIMIEESRLNKKGKPVEIQTTYISSDWQDPLKLDTSTNAVKLVYNSDDHIIKSDTYRDGSWNNGIEVMYEKNVIQQKKISRKDLSYTITYQHTYWD